MPFQNPILGGDVLVRTAMKSANYTSGSSGWRIARDGSVEFNNGIFRGSLSAGPNPGQHVTVGDPTTGDAMDVYNSANQLVFAVTNQGLAAAYSTGSSPNPSVGMQNAHMIFSDNATPTAHNATIQWNAPTVSAAQGILTILNSGYVGDVGALEVICGSADGTKRPTVQAVERGKQGSVLVSDQVSTNNLVRMGTFSGTTGPSGVLTIANAASFPIAGGIAFRDQTSASAGAWCAAAFNYGGTGLNTQWLIWNGTAVTTWNSASVSGTYLVWG